MLRDTKGTLTTDDDTFRLVFGGSNHDLVKVDAINNIYHTADETWVKVQYVTAGDYWLLWTKDGTKHRFGFNTDSKGIALGPDGITPVTYQYKIDEVTTTSGVSTRYTWVKVTAILQSTGQTYDQAMYPDKITWAYHSGSLVGSAREIRFIRGPRLDWTDTSTPTTQAFFEKDRLDAVEVWVGTGLVRKYVFTYDYSIDRDPTYTWQGGAAGDLTLKTITVYGTDGISAQPALNFTYTNARLTTTTNGIGGTFTTNYERVATSQLWTFCERYDGGGARIDWSVSTTQTAGATLLGHLITTGAPGDTTPLYKECKRFDGGGACVDWGLSTTTGTFIGRLVPTANIPGTRALYSKCLAGACLDWGADLSSGTLLGYLYVGAVDRYRVSSRSAADGRGNTVSSTHTYRDLALSANGLEFRGHRAVRTLDALRHYVDTWFNQDDVFKGRSFQTEARNSSNALFTQTVQTLGSSNPYPGVTLVKLTRTDVVTCEGSTPCRQVYQTFDYDAYGNRTGFHEWGDASVAGDERHEVTDWLVDASTWIHRPSRMALHDTAWVLQREKWFFYDDLAWGSLGSRGLLTKEEGRLVGARGTAGNPVVTYAYDVYGNRSSVTDPRGCTTTTTYETSQTYPATVTNCLTHVASFVYDARFGVQTSATDPNNQTTTYTYDVHGRPTRVTNPIDTASTYGTVSYTYPALGDPANQGVQVDRTTNTGTAQTHWTYHHFDGLGRIYWVRRPGQIGQVGSEESFDARGFVSAKSAPRFSTETAVWTTFIYDAMGRRTQVLNPDGTTVTTTYAVGKVTVTDERGSVKHRYLDAYARLTKVEEVNGAETYTTTHTYDAAGSLTQTLNHAGQLTTVTYDLLGRKTAMTDPNMGSWTYAYNAAGDLTSQTDAKNQTLTFTYDLLGRVRTKSYPGGAQITWTYDDPAVPNSKGRLTRVVDLATTTDVRYDAIGRTTQQSVLLDATTYIMAWTYNSLGQVRTQTFPDNDTVEYRYDGNTFLFTAFSNILHITNIDYNARGQATQLLYGNNVTTTFTYHPTTFRLTNRTTSGAGGSFQNLTYAYDTLGQITQVTDSLFTAGRTFTYDPLNRLTSASGTFGPLSGGLPTSVSQSYSFDAIGNITTAAGVVYTYSDPAHPSAVTGLSPGPTMTYDANGNMLTGAGRAATWDADNRLTATSIQGGNSATFGYDFTGRRVRKQTSAGVTRYPFPGYDIDPTGVVTKFIFIGKDRIAAKKSTGAALFYHNDHLGGVNVITDAAGLRVQLVEYEPWGMVSRTEGTADPTYRFNGRELDDPEIGLHYYGGRYYSAALRRFISADPTVGSLAEPQGLNRYSYVDNNPVNYTDPSGFKKKKGFWGNLYRSFVRAIPALVVGIVVGVAVGAALVATAGAAGVVIAPLLLGALAGAAGGAAAGAVNTAVNGGDLATNVLMGAALGGVAGAVGGPLAGALSKPLGALGSAVATGAIVGGGMGGVSAAASGGNILEGIAAGAITGAVVGAAVYGGFKAFEAYQGDSPAASPGGDDSAARWQHFLGEPGVADGVKNVQAITELTGVEQSASILVDSDTGVWDVRLLPDANIGTDRVRIDTAPSPGGWEKAATFHTHQRGTLAIPSAADRRIMPRCQGRCGYAHFVVHPQLLYGFDAAGTPFFLGRTADVLGR